MDQYLGQIEMLHGDPEQETSLGNVVNQMRDGFAKLMDTPNSIPLQNEVVSLADNLARTLNRLVKASTPSGPTSRVRSKARSTTSIPSFRRSTI